jgi:hypothetical protein
MQALTLVLLPSSLVAVPLLAGWYGRAARRDSPKSGPGARGRTKSHPKTDGPEPKRLPPKKKPKRPLPGGSTSIGRRYRRNESA